MIVALVLAVEKCITPAGMLPGLVKSIDPVWFIIYHLSSLITQLIHRILYYQCTLKSGKKLSEEQGN
jgi:hypothetical protein